MKERLAKGQGVIFAHWHGDELVLVSLVGHYRAATMVSTSKDGAIMNGVIRLLGAKTSRGSTTRGAIQALKGLVRLAKSGHNPTMAVDGPKGPLHRVKPGVFEISRLTQFPIIASAASCDRAIHFPHSWNKTFLPKPFAQVSVFFTEPFGPVEVGTDCKSLELAEKLASRINDAKQQAEGYIAAPSS